MSIDEGNFFERLKRYTQVSTTGVGLLARLIGDHYLGISINREKHAAQLRKALGDIKGPLMKIAQLVSTIPEALPPEYLKEFQELQSNAPPMGWPFVKRRMAAALGSDWQNKFAVFEHEAASAASLGQVHKAKSHDGTDLAVKLQYPQMDIAVETDLRQFKMILSLYHLYDKAITTDEVFKEIAERLREELNYHLESKHMELYHLMLAKEDQIHVPRPYPELSTEKLLSMTWLEGKKILDFVNEPAEIRNQIALNLFRAWYVPFYDYGTIHGDPHLGNYSITNDLSLNLLDFGCIRIFESKFVKGVIDLYFALLNNDDSLAVHAYESWGFQNLSNEMIQTLNIWARFLYAPLLEDRDRKIQEKEEKGIYGREIAVKVHKELRSLGGVSPPREFVFMDRAALGLGSVFMHLKAEINWYRLFHELIQGFDSEIMQERQDKALKEVGLK